MAKRDHGHAVTVADLQLADGFSVPAFRHVDFFDHKVVGQLQVVPHAGGDLLSGQLGGKFLLGDQHLIGAQLQQHVPVHLVKGLAGQMLHADGLQVHHGEHAGGQVGADGQDDLVAFGDAQLLQYVLVPDIGGHGARHLIRYLIHVFSLPVHGEHVRAAPGKLQRHFLAETAQSQYSEALHLFSLLIRSVKWYRRSGCGAPAGLPSGSPC